MTSTARARRIGDRIREELATLLLREVADPRIGRLTVTGVDVDRELSLATVYVTAADAGGRSDEMLAALRGAGGFLRTALAQRIPLRTFPRLRFRWDISVDHGARIEELLDDLQGRDAPGGEGQGEG
jgi:ribosome-binding factor A